MKKLLSHPYGGLIVLIVIAVVIGGSALTAAIVQKSLVAGLKAGGWATAALLGLLAVLMVVAGAASRIEELRAEDSHTGRSLPVSLLRAWAWGLVIWTAPRCALGEFLFVWAAIGTTLFFQLPRFLALDRPEKIAAAAVFFVVAGVINASFHHGMK
ncbi:MAG: hypothetical protein HY926_08715 [Elusimicrobia bacterium]|nr:hypothetical protein [Elusimicrobiota bacterium]